MAARTGTHRSRVGLALSATELTAAWGAAGGRVQTVRVPLASYPVDGGGWPALVAGLAEVARAAGLDHGGDLAVALLPPFVEVRRLELPPLSEGELLQLLARNGARYFLGARGPQVVGVTVPARRARREGPGPAPVLAASAPARIVNALHSAALEAGWTVSSVGPAESAWAAAAAALWPAFARRSAQVVIHDEERTTLLEMNGGHLTNVRLFRAGAVDVDLIAAAIAESAAGGGARALGALGESGRDELRRALANRGVSAAVVPGVWGEHAGSPEVMAAAFAARSADPILSTESERVAQRARIVRATLGVAIAAAIVFVASAGVLLWGVERDLRQVRAERAAIRAQVSATLVGRSSVEDAYRRLAALAAAQRSAPHWAPVLADLSARVPDDAYLSALHVVGDSLTVDGLATSAARVFDALEQSPELTGVRAPAPVRREAQENSPPMERFTIAAQLRSPAAGATGRAGAAAGAAGAPGAAAADPPRGGGGGGGGGPR